MRRAFICIALFLLVPIAVFSADYQYLYTGDEVLYLDLSLASNTTIQEGSTKAYNTIPNKICEAGYYSGSSQSQETQITVTCNYTDANGNFIMVSNSSNGQSYRHFSIGVNYIVNRESENIPLNPVKKNESVTTGSGRNKKTTTYEYYKANDSSFYKLVSNSGGGMKIPYNMPKSNSAKVGLTYNSLSTPWAFLTEFVIIMEDADGQTFHDIDHMTVADDYQAVLTFTMKFNGTDYIYQVSVRGYYGVQPSTNADCNLIISNYNSVLPLREMLTNWNSSTEYEVGHIYFESDAMYGISSSASNTVINNNNGKWKINVKPYPDTQTEFEFIYRKDTSIKFPVKVYIKGSNISLGNATKNSLTVSGTSIYTSNSTKYMNLETSTSGTIYPLCVSSQMYFDGDQHYTQVFMKYEGEICIKTDTSRTGMTKAALQESMRSGEYICSIQFEVISP